MRISPPQELTEGPWAQRDLDAGANLIIPIPAPIGGAVVVGENVVAYFAEATPPKVTPIQPTIIMVSSAELRMGVLVLQSAANLASLCS